MYYSPSTCGFYEKDIHGDAMPADVVQITKNDHVALLLGQSLGKHIVADENNQPVLADPPAPAKKQLIAALKEVVLAHFDAAAKAAGYDNMIDACSYADEAVVLKFRAEARALRAWRSQARDAFQTIIASVKAGTRAAPTASELIAELPVLVM